MGTLEATNDKYCLAGRYATNLAGENGTYGSDRVTAMTVLTNKRLGMLKPAKDDGAHTKGQGATDM